MIAETNIVPAACCTLDIFGSEQDRLVEIKGSIAGRGSTRGGAGLIVTGEEK